MSEIRQKVQGILNTESNSSSSYKKEVTKGIVNELKSKIQNFKNKKNSDKENARTNELDIEVNKELLGKFKKSETLPSQFSKSHLSNNKEADIKQGGTNVVNTNTNSYKNSNTGTNKKFDNLLREITFSSEEKPSTPDSNSNYRAQFTLNQSSNSIIEENKQSRGYPSSDKVVNLVNTRPIKSFLNFNSEKRNVSEEKKITIENKRTHILETLSANNKKSDTYFQLNNSSYSNKSQDEKNKGIKDKIKKIVFDLDSNSKNSETNFNIIGTNVNKSSYSKGSFSFSSKINEKNNRISNTLSNNIPTYTPSKEETYKKNSTLMDYKNKNNYKSTKLSRDDEEYDLKLNRNKKDDEFFTRIHEPKVKEYFRASSFKYTPDDVKKITTQLRFISNEDLRIMDANLVEELITLSSTISKLFEWKIKTREYLSK